MIKMMRVVGKKGNPNYLANGQFETEVAEGEERFVSFSKKGKVILYKNPKFKWVTVDLNDVEKCFEIKEAVYFKSYNERDIKSSKLQ